MLELEAKVWCSWPASGEPQLEGSMPSEARHRLSPGCAEGLLRKGLEARWLVLASAQCLC